MTIKFRYHPGKANVEADAISRKERVKPNRVRAMNMTLQLSIKDRILAAQKEAVDEFAGLQKGENPRNGRTSADAKILLDQEKPTELVGDLGSGEKGKKEISTANISVSTASATPEVSISTAAKNLVYIRRSVEKRKDKGKAIMKEDESVQKKTKKQLEQERLGHEEAIRLQE
ncbi:hypothetical protein Tco_1092004 [Tanacetum coccineum]|uniref:Reverse transcriptase domain-containing protein n=1 Tax=Tanacetum coccineum TaxID=301880 RepID=A0ABQ5I8Q9_9ASTR